MCFAFSQFGNIATMNDERQRYAIHAAVFAALANPTRHELFHHLCGHGRRPGELAELAGVSKANVSQHLSILQREGLVRRSRVEGRVVWEVVDPRLAQACALIDEVVGGELRAQATALERKVSHDPDE
jgi:DNA-binding transcriptional ArsR family regulator